MQILDKKEEALQTTVHMAASNPQQINEVREWDVSNEEMGK